MPDEITVETSNGTLAVEDTGPPGTPVVLVHGAITNLRAWDRVIRALGPGLRAVSFDLPAHGQTQGGSPTFAHLTRDLVALVDQLSFARPILVGHSYGGLAALAAAGSNPSRFGGVMAIDPYLSNHGGHGPRTGHRSVEEPLSAARDQPWPWGVVSDIDADIEQRMAEFGYAGEYAADVRVAMRRGYRPHSDRAFLRYPRKEDNMEMIAASWELDVDAAYDEVTCPLAIAIAADFGPRFPDPSLVEGRRQDLQKLKDRLPDLHSVEFPCGHDVPGLMPTELAAFITDWAQRIHR